MTLTLVGWSLEIFRIPYSDSTQPCRSSTCRKPTSSLLHSNFKLLCQGQFWSPMLNAEVQSHPNGFESTASLRTQEERFAGSSSQPGGGCWRPDVDDKFCPTTTMFFTHSADPTLHNCFGAQSGAQRKTLKKGAIFFSHSSSNTCGSNNTCA